MNTEPNNSMWYRVAGLRPSLGGHACIQRQNFRGQVWYVLHNRISGRSYRFSASGYHFVGLMDGIRTVQALREANIEAMDEAALTQDEIIELLGKLFTAEVLQTDALAEIAVLFDRRTRRRQADWLGRLKNPLAIRLPLLDPDRYLERMRPFARLLFSRAGAVLWLLVVGLGLVLAVTHWGEISRDTSSDLLSLRNLVLLGLCYPFIKALHELGHGLAAKVWGGEVHETGFLLLALMPVPYVDASSASAFPEKHRRMLVGAAGMLVEVFLAALALFLWLNTEPGLVHALAFNTMLIGGVSTLLFNGNPLLRFDGYYVFSDAIGMPNLASRATRYLGYLVQRYLFGLAGLTSPAGTPEERYWLAGYGILAYLYRIFIMVSIMLFVAEAYPFLGLLIAMWAGATMLVMPVIKQAGFVLKAPRLQRHRLRAVSTSSALVGCLAGFLLVVPFPLSTLAEGVVSPPDHSEIRAGGDGVIIRLLARPDTRVKEGEPLIETEDPFVQTELQILEAQLRELTIEQGALQVDGKQVKAEMLAEEIKILQEDLASTREQANSLLIRSPVDGIFLVDQPGDLPGLFVSKGDRLGYVTNLEKPTVRVAIPQADIGLVRTRTVATTVRLAGQPDTTVTAVIERQAPAAVERLPSPALGPLGGGPFAVDRSDPDGVRAVEELFEVELTLPVAVSHLGERVYVRFDHGSEPLARQWYRRLRQLFLKRFNV
jgi:putative peptide zinc metalloprotease protein